MRIGGVIKLERVHYPCALAPVLDANFDEPEDEEPADITQDNVMQCIDTFYISTFNGHVDYELFA